MERHKKDKRRRKKSPRVPIKTYKWEDVRRARLKGGYPWTYLYKEPFSEHIDPKLFVMEATPKSKSSSSLQKSIEGIDIKEVTNGIEHELLTPEPSGYIVITEVPSDSENHSKNVTGGSVIIEDVDEPEVLNLESAESSDNISQYLDKEEPVTELTQTTTKTHKSEDAGTSGNGRQDRAKSEEPKRKRKLSIDSSYSRKSLSKLAIIKKLKEAKEKIKIPKLNISIPRKQESKKEKKEQTEKKPPQDITEFIKPPKNATPVYIHIPLKPPEGQTDEFSYLEFGEKKPEDETKPESETKSEDAIKPEEEIKPEDAVKPEDEPKSAAATKPEETDKTTEKIAADQSSTKDQLTSQFLHPKYFDQRRHSEHPEDIIAIEIVKAQSIDLDDASGNGLDELCIIQHDDDAHKDDIMIYLPAPENAGLERKPSKKKTPSRQGSIRSRGRSAEPERPESRITRERSAEPERTDSRKTRAKSAEPERTDSRKTRAKSAEPERKRKLSIESSYSRISLSKLGILKKLKSVKEKFKFPKLSLSRSNSKKEPKKSKTESEPKEIKAEDVKPAATSATPQYIHIPLKPPAGQTDEFSYLEFEGPEEKKEVEPIKDETEKKEEQISLESPASVQNEGVQFIFLTPPSDDEILDHPEVPETPSETNKNFFPSETLKKIAEEAVDKVSPESQRKKLEPVGEEDDKSKSSQTSDKSDDSKDKSETPTETPENAERMVVDEEDGLKLTESAMARQEQNIKSKEVPEPPQELKSSLKADGSPTLRKKVCFKRRSKDDSKDGIYEDIQVPTDDKEKQEDKVAEETKGKITVLGTSQSMSVDEEKSYLDEQKIIKTTSLEEDYNRWSKLSDHEYEPVNPPPDNVGWKSSLSSETTPIQAPAQTPASTVHVIETDQGLQARPISQASSTTSLERRMLGAETEPTPEESFTVQEMQTQIESTFFSKTKATPSKQETQRQPNPVATSEPETPPPKTEGPGKFQQAQQAIKTQAGKFKTKLHGMKKPTIKLPSKPKITKPNFERFKIQKPNIHLPKMPDTTKINLPSFSLPRKNPLKRSLKQRHLSTESNAGDSKTNYFDFMTYPRIFKKKQKDDFDSSFSSKSEREVPEFATVPRTKRNQEETDRWGGRDTIRIPLHQEDSTEDKDDREDSVERRMASHMRYDQDIDIDDAYERENQEIHTASPFSHDYNSRWKHGSFHPEPNLEYRENNKNRQVTDLDFPSDAPNPNESFDTNTSKDIHSSESSLGIHRRGVLEEIDSDEFFLRQKGISQDNIEVGMYLSSEIREAFKSPTNALADLQRDPREFSYEIRTSNQSLPETPSKRKPIKKPKRKKTPHVSQEQIPYDQDSETELAEIPPSRPKRRSKRSRRPKQIENVIPYQETIAVDVPEENLGILSNREEPEEYKVMYENERMLGREQPEIKVTDPYADFKYEERYDSDDEVFRDEAPPAAPRRRNRSLKSLNFSEHDSILGDFNLDQEPLSHDIEVYKTEHEYIIPTPEIPPVKPPRTLSRSSSKSRENEEVLEGVVETPVRPVRTRSQSQTRSRDESLNMEPEPCIEEPCVQDFRDHMGYAVIDKQIKREPPLPPPRTPPRRKRSVQSAKSSVSEQKFFTVPRPLNDEPPTRPLRNYSTLGPSRPPRRKPPVNMTDEEKENIDITQYIEIEDEPNRDLHSGEVIQKMRDRPLPAPPRPPRKTKTLQDITSQENILSASNENLPDDSFDIDKPEHLEESRIVEEILVGAEEIQGDADETEVSTQTEPLPDDFVCEELVQEEHDKTITPSKSKTTEYTDGINVERRLITPTHYTYEEETITHGSLVVEPLNGAKILPDSQLTRRETPAERFIPVTKDYDDETSEIPEEFTKLKDPAPARSNTPQSQPSIVERIIERPVLVQPDSSSEVEVLRAQKLQVTDLDVDRLSVNELLASRIIVSEIDSGNIHANEISSKSGALKLGEIELPPGVVQQLFERLQSVVQEQQISGPIHSQPVAETSSKKEESEDAGQKKNSV